MTVRVLVVDDEPDVEALLRRQFLREGLIHDLGLWRLGYPCRATALARGADEFLIDPVSQN